MKYCSHCDLDVDDSYQTCPECGSDLLPSRPEKATTAEKSDEQKDGSKKDEVWKVGNYNGFSIVAVCCAVAAFVPYIGFAAMVCGIVFGVMALKQINQPDLDAGEGKWLALVGIIVPALLAVLYLAGILLVGCAFSTMLSPSVATI